MAGLADRRIHEALAALGSPAEPPAAGVAAALTGAIAASLVELSAGLAAKRLADDADADAAIVRMRALAARAGELRGRLLEAADQDVESYAGVASAPDDPSRAAALAAAAEPPLVIAECAAEVAEAAAEVAVIAGAWPFGPDAVVAGELATAAARGGAQLVAANLSATSDDPRTARARDAADRAARAAGTTLAP